MDATLVGVEGSFENEEVEEAYTVTAADKKGNTKAYQNYKAGMKNKITGKPLYKAAPHLAKEELMQEALPALAALAPLAKGLVAKAGAKIAAKGGAKAVAKKALTKVKPIAKHVGAEVVADRIANRGNSDNDNTNDRVNTSGY